MVVNKYGYTNLDQSEFEKQINEEWKTLPLNEKEVYSQRAQKEKENYQEQLKQYKAKKKAKEDGEKSEASIKEDEELEILIKAHKEKCAQRKLLKKQQAKVKIYIKTY